MMSSFVRILDLIQSVHTYSTKHMRILHHRRSIDVIAHGLDLHGGETFETLKSPSILLFSH